MMSSQTQGRRPPFVLKRVFLETPFEHRFQGWLRHAWHNRSWHVIAAIPGSGKSSGIHDLQLYCGARKEATGLTCLPLLAVRAPKNDVRGHGLVSAFASAFGVLPTMSAAFRRAWLVRMMAQTQVECIIVDDMQDFDLPHFALLKELTDNLAAPPYQRSVGLALVAAHGNKDVPFRETFAGPEILWRQFARRLDAEHPYIIVPGHSEAEVRPILATFEDLYREQLPDIQLCRWTKSFFTWLTNPILDPDATGRVSMDHLTKLVTIALRRAYERGATDVDAALLQEVADLLILRRQEISQDKPLFPDDSDPEQEVG